MLGADGGEVLRMTARRFGLALTSLVALALSLRLAYALAAVPSPAGDADWYHRVANGIADGHGFRNPFQGWRTAFHPPLFPALLALVSKLGGHTMTAHQLAGCAMGAAGVGAVGALGRRVAGDAAGLAAAAVAAVYPSLIAADSVTMSESLFVPLAALALLLALRAAERPSAGRALALGAVCGLAALTRTEGLLLALLLALALAARLRTRRLAGFGLALAAAIAVVAPWCVRNSLVWDRPVGTVTGDGSIVAGANCATTYSGERLGQWDFNCLRRGVPSGLRADEPEASARWRRAGLDYAGDHSGRLPLVLAARVLRTWNLWNPRTQARLASFELGTPAWLEWLTVAGALVVIALAALGAGALRRRPSELTVLLAPLVMVTLTSLAGYGQPRFRAGADVALAVLAGVAAVAAARRLRALLARRSEPATAVPEDRGSPVAPL